MKDKGYLTVTGSQVTDDDFVIVDDNDAIAREKLEEYISTYLTNNNTIINNTGTHIGKVYIGHTNDITESQVMDKRSDLGIRDVIKGVSSETYKTHSIRYLKGLKYLDEEKANMKNFTKIGDSNVNFSNLMQDPSALKHSFVNFGEINKSKLQSNKQEINSNKKSSWLDKFNLFNKKKNSPFQGR